MPVKKPSTMLRAGMIPGQRVTKEKVERSRELLREMTPAEKALWQELRANKLGVHFRRHTAPAPKGRCRGQIIAEFIVDFYCHKVALVIEVDGDIHDLQQEEDTRREKVLREMGLTIIRVRNEAVIRDLPTVVGKIRSLISI